jgi:hypothetical protein
LTRLATPALPLLPLLVRPLSPPLLLPPRFDSPCPSYTPQLVVTTSALVRAMQVAYIIHSSPPCLHHLSRRF